MCNDKIWTLNQEDVGADCIKIHKIHLDAVNLEPPFFKSYSWQRRRKIEQSPQIRRFFLAIRRWTPSSLQRRTLPKKEKKNVLFNVLW